MISGGWIKHEWSARPHARCIRCGVPDLTEVCQHGSFRGPGVCPQCVSLYCAPTKHVPEPIAPDVREALEARIAALEKQCADQGGLLLEVTHSVLAIMQVLNNGK